MSNYIILSFNYITMLNISYRRQQSFICIHCIFLGSLESLQVKQCFNCVTKSMIFFFFLRNVHLFLTSTTKNKEKKNKQPDFVFSFVCDLCHSVYSFFFVTSSPCFFSSHFFFLMVASLYLEPRENYVPYYFQPLHH
jgi:hypothetical protein